eukprot:scaffold41641_cov18-Tisochrysis_lutea.AAC.1
MVSAGSEPYLQRLAYSSFWGILICSYGALPAELIRSSLPTAAHAEPSSAAMELTVAAPLVQLPICRTSTASDPCQTQRLTCSSFR